jgi:hypothetical protein
VGEEDTGCVVAWPRKIDGAKRLDELLRRAERSGAACADELLERLWPGVAGPVDNPSAVETESLEEAGETEDCTEGKFPIILGSTRPADAAAAAAWVTAGSFARATERRCFTSLSKLLKIYNHKAGTQ